MLGTVGPPFVCKGLLDLCSGIPILFVSDLVLSTGQCACGCLVNMEGCGGGIIIILRCQGFLVVYATKAPHGHECPPLGR